MANKNTEKKSTTSTRKPRTRKTTTRKKKETKQPIEDIEVKAIVVESDGSDSLTMADLDNADKKNDKKNDEKNTNLDSASTDSDTDTNITTDINTLGDGVVSSVSDSDTQSDNGGESNEGNSETDVVEVAEDYIADENLRKYLETALVNQAQRAVASKTLNLDLASVRTFVEESCNSCQYGDYDRAMKFAVKCINRVSSTLLMNDI